MTPIELVGRLLGECGIMACIVGEVALNYYNVPRAIYELELCVSRGFLILAAAKLCLSGNFEPCDPEPVIDNYTKYKRGFPRLRTTSLPGTQRTLVIFTADVYGLEPLKRTSLRAQVPDGCLSKEMEDFSPDELAVMTMPRLAPFLAGLASKFLSTRDDMSMIAVEGLVDGMDLDEGWVRDQLQDCEPGARALILQQVAGKTSRLDPFSGNAVTCFVRDEEEAAHVKSRAGYI